jgi:hypothetical protein
MWWHSDLPASRGEPEQSLETPPGTIPRGELLFVPAPATEERLDQALDQEDAKPGHSRPVDGMT